MKLSTGSRVTINGKNGTVVVTDWHGNAKMVKYDNKDYIFEVRDETIKPIIIK